jgi:hypothetical protein
MSLFAELERRSVFRRVPVPQRWVPRPPGGCGPGDTDHPVMTWAAASATLAPR